MPVGSWISGYLSDLGPKVACEIRDEILSKKPRKNNGVKLFTLEPKANRFREYGPPESGFRAWHRLRGEQPIGYNPRKQREFPNSGPTGERVESGGWRAAPDEDEHYETIIVI